MDEDIVGRAARVAGYQRANLSEGQRPQRGAAVVRGKKGVGWGSSGKGGRGWRKEKEPERERRKEWKQARRKKNGRKLLCGIRGTFGTATDLLVCEKLLVKEITSI